MESHLDWSDFTVGEQLLLDVRVAEANPEFASDEEITKIFGKPFSA